MVNIIVVQLLSLLFCFQLFAKVDRVHLESYLGEKRLDAYTERYEPLIFQDIYQGKLSFEDEIFFHSYFDPYLFEKERDFTHFLKSELKAGAVCTNEQLSEHFDDIRYSYRLISLSYLLEGAWQMNMTARHLRWNEGCVFNLPDWLKSCRPKSEEMKKFISRLGQYVPQYDERMPKEYQMDDWMNEFNSKKFNWFSQYRIEEVCPQGCKEKEIEKKSQNVCVRDQKLMTLICSEMDDIYGLSQNRDAYYLLGLSNIVNSYNKNGEALGCLRRFSEVMSHKEVQYPGLSKLFPFLQSYLRKQYQERFLQGRVFFYGSGKEFEAKGLKDFYVKDQPMLLEKHPKLEEITVVKKVVKTPEIKMKAISKVVAPKEVPKPLKNQEIKTVSKSAFLVASEMRVQSNLDTVEVDMMKLKYDYVFSLNMINSLSERLKSFMTREALVEMMNYDKLGTKQGPVPLLFIKFMIDMEEHHGLWNIVSVLGDKFYVSNEIDSTYKPNAEFIQLVNNEATGKQWQISVLRP